ncbi:MAG: Ku protein [Spirochaetales bacterium]|nr:Ku protein [Spirochaetales bacterium]
MRSIWKGHIRFSMVTIPVRVYNALETGEQIRFNQIHRECNGPVGYRKYCKKCDATLESQDIVKGFQYEPDHYVVMEDDDFQKVKLKSTKILDIEAFVSVDEVAPTLFEQPYFAGPDGPVSGKSYSLLVQALRESRKVAVGKLILRDREDVVLIAPEADGLLFYRLRYPGELRKMKDVPQLGDLPATKKEEQKLALSLIETMTRPLSELDLKDGYQGALKELIEAKIAGQEIVVMEEEEETPVDIMTALKASIEKARSETRGMAVATGKKTGRDQAAVVESEKKPARKSRKKAV